MRLTDMKVGLNMTVMFMSEGRDWIVMSVHNTDIHLGHNE